MNNSNSKKNYEKITKRRKSNDFKDVYYYSSLIPRSSKLVDELIKSSSKPRSCFIGIERKCKCLMWASAPDDKILAGFCLIEILIDKRNGGNSVGCQFMVDNFFKILKQLNNVTINRLPYVLEKSFEENKLKKQHFISTLSRNYKVSHVSEILKKNLFGNQITLTESTKKINFFSHSLFYTDQIEVKNLVAESKKKLKFRHSKCRFAHIIKMPQNDIVEELSEFIKIGYFDRYQIERDENENFINDLFQEKEGEIITKCSQEILVKSPEINIGACKDLRLITFEHIERTINSNLDDLINDGNKKPLKEIDCRIVKGEYSDNVRLYNSVLIMVPEDLYNSEKEKFISKTRNEFDIEVRTVHVNWNLRNHINEKIDTIMIKICLKPTEICVIIGRKNFENLGNTIKNVDFFDFTNYSITLEYMLNLNDPSYLNELNVGESKMQQKDYLLINEIKQENEIIFKNGIILPEIHDTILGYKSEMVYQGIKKGKFLGFQSYEKIIKKDIKEKFAINIISQSRIGEYNTKPPTLQDKYNLLMMELNELDEELKCSKSNKIIEGVTWYKSRNSSEKITYGNSMNLQNYSDIFKKKFRYPNENLLDTTLKDFEEQEEISKKTKNTEIAIEKITKRDYNMTETFEKMLSHQSEILENEIIKRNVSHFQNYDSIVSDIFISKESTLLQSLGEKFYYLSDLGVKVKRLNDSAFSMNNLELEKTYDISLQDQDFGNTHNDFEILTYLSETYRKDSADRRTISPMKQYIPRNGCIFTLLNDKILNGSVKEIIQLSTQQNIKDYNELIRPMSFRNKKTENYIDFSSNLSKEISDIVICVIFDLLETIIVDNEPLMINNLEEHLELVDSHKFEDIKLDTKVESVKHTGSQNVLLDENVKEFQIMAINPNPKMTKVTALKNKSMSFNKIYTSSTILRKIKKHKTSLIKEIEKFFKTTLLLEMIKETILDVLRFNIPKTLSNDRLFSAKTNLMEPLFDKQVSNIKPLKLEVCITTESDKSQAKESEILKDPNEGKESKSKFKKIKQSLLQKHLEKEQKRKSFNHKQRIKSVYKGNILDKLIMETLIRCKYEKEKLTSSKNQMKEISYMQADVKPFNNKLDSGIHKLKTNETNGKNIKIHKFIKEKPQNTRKNVKITNLSMKFGEEFIRSRGSNVIFRNDKKDDTRKVVYEPQIAGDKYMTSYMLAASAVPLEKNIESWMVYDTRPQVLQTNINNQLINKVLKNKTNVTKDVEKNYKIINEEIDNYESNANLNRLINNDTEYSFVTNINNQSLNNKYSNPPVLFDTNKTGNNNFIKLDLYRSCEFEKSKKEKISENMEKNLHDLVEISIMESDQSKVGKSSNMDRPIKFHKKDPIEDGSTQFIAFDEKCEGKDTVFFISYNKSSCSNHEENTKKTNLTFDRTGTNTSKIFDDTSLETNENEYIVDVIMTDNEHSTNEFNKIPYKRGGIKKNSKTIINRKPRKIIVKPNSSISSFDGIQINYRPSLIDKKYLSKKIVKGKLGKQKESLKTIVNFPAESWASCFDFVLKQVLLNSHFMS